MYHHITCISLQYSARHTLTYYPIISLKITFMQFTGGAPQCCIYFYTRSVIAFRGRRGLYKAVVGLQLTHYVTSHL